MYLHQHVCPHGRFFEFQDNGNHVFAVIPGCACNVSCPRRESQQQLVSLCDGSQPRNLRMLGFPSLGFAWWKGAGDEEVDRLDKKLLQWQQMQYGHIDQSVSLAFQSYVRCAQVLHGAPEMQSFKDEVLRMYAVATACKYVPAPFIGIGAPSGSGKTQTAFTLATFPCLQVVHICLASLSECSQYIYRHPQIAEISSILRAELLADYNSLKDGSMTQGFTAPSLLMTIELKVVNLLAKIFNVKSSTGGLPTTPRQFRAALDAKTKDKWPVVVVDEAYMRGGPESDKVVLLRSILRACGVVSIFMGTTITMVSYIGSAAPGMSSGTHRPTEWATLITKLPEYANPDFDTAVIRSADVRQFVQHLLEHYRRVNPRNMGYLCEMAEKGAESATIDSVLRQMAYRIYAGKTALHTLEGVRAQVHFLLDGAATAEHMHSHFARYEENMKVARWGSSLVLLTADGAVQQGAWPPVPHFPPSSEDPLLPLLLGGSCRSAIKHPSPFSVVDTNYGRQTVLTSTAAILLSMERSTEPQAARNTAVLPGVQGNLLECTVALSCINASRAQGVAGVPVLDFLRYLTLELMPPVAEQEVTWHPDVQVEHFFAALATEVVPYTTRVGDRFATSGSILDGTLVLHASPAQQSTSDGYIEGIAMTDNNAAVSLDTVREICQRFASPKEREQRKFGLALVSKLPELSAELGADLDSIDVDEETNVILLSVKYCQLVVQSLLPRDRDEPLQPRARTLFFLECYSEKIAREWLTITHRELKDVVAFKPGPVLVGKKQRRDL